MLGLKCEGSLLTLLVRRVLAAEPAELAELEPLGTLPPVFRRAVIAAFALRTRQRDDFAHDLNPWISGFEDWEIQRLRSS